MASDIQKAINSGGYVIVPERAVDGVGRDAIYVYMTYNAQTGNQSWKISGGLNGGTLSFYAGLGLTSATILALLGPIALAGAPVLIGIMLTLVITFAYINTILLLAQAAGTEDGIQPKCFFRGLVFPFEAIGIIAPVLKAYGILAKGAGEALFSLFAAVMQAWGYAADVSDIETPGQLDECKVLGG